MIPRRSLAEIRSRAMAELERNPTITVYAMRDGRELDRRRVLPWSEFRRSLERLGQAFISIKPAFEEFSGSLARAIDAIR